MPRVLSAIVCTRNRPEPTARVVKQLLQGESQDFELILVDQSDGEETKALIDPLCLDHRLRYVRSQRRGKGAALNEGISFARGAIVVCTDDDCLPPPRWVENMTSTLEQHPESVVLFCRVDPVPYDRSKGYVPAYELERSRTLASVGDICNGLGIGAGMALNREFVLSMGGLDECFGPGGRFPSADEWDIAIRALLSGRCVSETADLTIVHDGYRSFEEGRTHARRDWLALGAVCAKPIRAGRLGVLRVAAWLFFSKAVWPPVADLLSLRKPRGLGRIFAFIEGFSKGAAVSVDRKTLRYSARS